MDVNGDVSYDVIRDVISDVNRAAASDVILDADGDLIVGGGASTHVPCAEKARNSPNSYVWLGCHDGCF